jgi:hypothetical protein
MRSLRSDLHRLDKLAFNRRARCGPLLEKFHAMAPQIAALPAALADQVWNIYDWLLVPLSLWPIDFIGLANHLLSVLASAPLPEEAGASQSPHLRIPVGNPSRPTASLEERRSKIHNPPASPIENQKLKIENFLTLIDPPPPESTQSTVAEFEHDIESGRYEKMLKQAAKFEEQEKALLQNQQLASEWAEIKRQFDIKQFQNARGVIRRRMSLERNFREATWHFDPSDPRCLFHFVFDAFCYRWKLYGMEHDRPLLLKISVNPTPHGTMILIPRHWSLDPRRDLDWPLISRLHRSRGAKKQGPKLSPAQTQKLADAIKVQKLFQQSCKQGLKGEALHQFLCERMKRDPRSDRSWWKRLL